MMSYASARDLSFLDYIGCNEVNPEIITEIVSGIANACSQISCALVGGEISEMRDVYHKGYFELTGFAVGIIDKDNMLGPERVTGNAVVVGLDSSGVHANGFTLVRKVFEDLDPDDWSKHDTALGCSLIQSLLTPTRCYAKLVCSLVDKGLLQAAAHISGGGLIDNLPRVVGDDLRGRIRRGGINVPPVFRQIQTYGQVDEEEMWHVFNMGIGYALLVAPEDVSASSG